MKLLEEKELIWTSVVANSTMNRERNLIGINSYEKDLYFDILGFIKQNIRINDKFRWVDLCCGRGKALLQASEFFSGLGLADNLILEGLDLVGMFEAKLLEQQKVQLSVVSLLEWNPTQKYDLITCVHGLHYIGDKLLVLEKIMSSLKQYGKFIGNIDFRSIQNANNKPLKQEILQYLDIQNIHYDIHKKILSAEGNTILNFPYQYLGANTEAGKNYTGQEAIDSIYSQK